VFLEGGGVRVGETVYPVLNDVIVLTDPSEYSHDVRLSLGGSRGTVPRDDFAEDIQATFGAEWKDHSTVLPEHQKEFEAYFDLVDLEKLKDSRVCDLGCGMGRWSSFLKNKCRELVLVDFSDAVFMARKNLQDCPHALFFMGDLTKLPFRKDFADFLFCLGVLHHLPVPCLNEVRRLGRYAPRLLIFLYYALDNRPFYFQWILELVTLVRRTLSKIRSPFFRRTVSTLGALFIYKPLVILGAVLNKVGCGSYVPLYDFYREKSVQRIAQDVYDRFFTRIEQRVYRRDIEKLTDTFAHVVVSKNLPYWHFVCEL